MAEAETQATNTPARNNERASYWARAKELLGKTPNWVTTSLACLVTSAGTLYVHDNWSFQRLSNLNVKSVEVSDVNGDGKMDAIVNRYIGSNSTYLSNQDGSTTLEGRTD